MTTSPPVLLMLFLLIYVFTRNHDTSATQGELILLVSFPQLKFSSSPYKGEWKHFFFILCIFGESFENIPTGPKINSAPTFQGSIQIP